MVTIASNLAPAFAGLFVLASASRRCIVFAVREDAQSSSQALCMFISAVLGFT